MYFTFLVKSSQNSFFKQKAKKHSHKATKKGRYMIAKLLLVFLAGGLLSGIAQLLIDLTKLTPAKILVLYVCIGVFLFGVGAYEPAEKVFGAGVSLPLIGFGANIGRGVKEAVDERGAIGILSGGLTASSAGITAALVLGLITSIIFKSSQKKL